MLYYIKHFFNWRERYLIVTPAWYAYGEMFQSLFWAVNISVYYNKKLILTYSDVHIRKNTKLPAICNNELKIFYINGIGSIGKPISTISKILTIYINFSRKYFDTLIGRILNKISRKKILKKKIGFYGHKDDNDLRKLLSINEPINWEYIFNHPVQIDLTPEQVIRGKREFNKLGIPDGKKFVCIYVRDSGFTKEHSQLKLFKYFTANIYTYQKAIKTIMDKGYYVVRTGDRTEKPLKDHHHFIDYVHSPYFSDILDLYLYRKCEFLMSTGGGGRCAGTFYNKNTLVTNWTPIHTSGNCTGKNDTFITKHVFSIEKNRLLSLKEQLILIDTETNHWGFLPDDKYMYVDNSEDELNQMIKEWFKFKENSNYDWNNSLQEEYHNLRQKHTRRKFEKIKRMRGFESNFEKYFHLKPKVCKPFLEKCWEFGDYLNDLTIQFKRTHLN